MVSRIRWQLTTVGRRLPYRSQWFDFFTRLSLRCGSSAAVTLARLGLIMKNGARPPTVLAIPG